ncbi:MAG: caspase family protein [Xanthobacteraceae bacterium]
MPKWLIAFVVVLVVALASVGNAAADRRVALVIRSGAYKNVPALPNPPNDGADVAAAFERLGFSVQRLPNAGFDAMRRGLIDFGKVARGADIVAVFFAGHGMEIAGENWLIPVDAELKSDTDVENEAISLRSVLLQVAGATTLGLVILDACRNNPFSNRIQRTVRVRSVDRGLSRVEPTDNVLVAYSARDGTTAIDGNGRNSPFTVALLHNIETPGLEISFMFRRVRDEVMAATNREQQPFVYGSLSKEEIFLKAPLPGATVAAVAPPSQPISPPTSPPVSRPAMATVEEAAIGTWELFVPNNHGLARWTWEIQPSGNYHFRSRGPGAAPAHDGTINVTDGKWSIHANSGLPGYEDGGSYEVKDRDTLVMTGKLGTGVWHRAGTNDTPDRGAR